MSPLLWPVGTGRNVDAMFLEIPFQLAGALVPLAFIACLVFLGWLGVVMLVAEVKERRARR